MLVVAQVALCVVVLWSALRTFPWWAALPLTYAVSLLRGIWHGDGWSSHVGDLGTLILISLVCMALSAKVFRWE